MMPHEAAVPVAFRNKDWKYFSGANFLEISKQKSVRNPGPQVLLLLPGRYPSRALPFVSSQNIESCINPEYLEIIGLGATPQEVSIYHVGSNNKALDMDQPTICVQRAEEGALQCCRANGRACVFECVLCVV